MDDPIRVHDCPCCTCSPDPEPSATRPRPPIQPRLILTAAQHARRYGEALQQARETVAAARVVLSESQYLPRLRQRRSR